MERCRGTKTTGRGLWDTMPMRSMKPLGSKRHYASVIACLCKIRSLFNKVKVVVRSWRPITITIHKLDGVYSRLESERNGSRCFRSDLTEIPKGYLPIYVGKGITRFVINVHLLNHPVFAELLQMSADKYGYDQSGGLKIPCDVVLFHRIMYSIA
eukprot:Gb_38676 [translate_table: standard]